MRWIAYWKLKAEAERGSTPGASDDGIVYSEDAPAEDLAAAGLGRRK